MHHVKLQSFSSSKGEAEKSEAYKASAYLEVFDKDICNPLLTGKALFPRHYKQIIQHARAQLEQKFCENKAVELIICAYVALIDRLLIHAWSALVNQDEITDANTVALIAVGGYGRNNLHLHSDIDLLILSEYEISGKLTEMVEKFLSLIWDTGLQPGASVRSLQQCLTLAKSDQTVLTSLLDARLLISSQSPSIKKNSSLIIAQLNKGISSANMWPKEAYLKAKQLEQKKRYAKFDKTAYNLEPNIKSSPGGLRDYDTVLWLAYRFFGVSSLKELTQNQLISSPEYQSLIQARTFLSRVRWALHQISGRTEDRLLFHYQQELAVLFSYRDTKKALAVELFMKDFFRSVTTLFNLKEILLQHFQEYIYPFENRQSQGFVHPDFQVTNSYIGTKCCALFNKKPASMMELFWLLTKKPEIQGVQANTIRQMMSNSSLIDDTFRSHPMVKKQFIDILKSHNAAKVIHLMANYNLLGLYLPEFGYIIGQMQYDLFHIYTVDAHTIFVLDLLCQLESGDKEQELPLATKAKKELPKKELVHIAALYHDIGKGRGGNHSILGAEYAHIFCSQHGLTEEDTRLVCWLIKNHLLMSTTSQRKDIYDASIITEFASIVGNVDYLNYLYCLTVADICATNPRLWNGWRAALLRQLYQSTKDLFQNGLGEEAERFRLTGLKKKNTMQLLAASKQQQAIIQNLWNYFDNDYFRRHTASEIAWHTGHIIKHQELSALVITRETNHQQAEISTQIAIYSRRNDSDFAVITDTLDAEGLSVQDARLTTTTQQYTLSTFVVMVTASGKPIGSDHQFINHIGRRLKKELCKNNRQIKSRHRHISSQIRQFISQPTVTLTHDLNNFRTIIEVSTTDCPGLLAFLARTLLDFNLRIQNAKITTLGDKVRDVFFVTDENNHPLKNPESLEKIRTDLHVKLCCFQGHIGAPPNRH